MFTQKKSDGARSSAGTNVKKGSKGRLELYAVRRPTEAGTQFDIKFSDIGNYGAERWWGEFTDLTRSDIQDIIDSLSALTLNEVDSTYISLEEEIIEGEVEVEPETELVEEAPSESEPIDNSEGATATL